MKWHLNPVFSILLSLALLLPVSTGSASGPAGEIRWTGGYVRGVGQGTATPSGNRVKDRLMALRAAEVSAQRALAESIHGVRIDGETTVGGAMKDSAVTTRVQGVVRGAQKIREEVTWDGEIPSATVELRICLFIEAAECRAGTALIQALPIEDRKQPSYVPAVQYEESARPGDASTVSPVESGKPSVASYDTTRPVTGLILQASGLRFERELFPVVVTRVEGGELQTVFSAKSVKPEIIRTFGVVRYADTVDQALKDKRLGANPLTIRLSEVTRDNLLVLRPEAAKTLRETTRYGNDYLGEAKVVIAGK